jgi:hypothetical protein
VVIGVRDENEVIDEKRSYMCTICTNDYEILGRADVSFMTVVHTCCKD